MAAFTAAFLDEKLPRFQIVATTHSPMTAQQAGRGEVHAFARPAPGAPPELRRCTGAPDRLGLHQLMQPFFNVDTVESARVAGLKNECCALKEKRPKSPEDKKRLLALRDELADAPAWNGGEETRAQTEALEAIQIAAGRNCRRPAKASEPDRRQSSSTTAVPTVACRSTNSSR